MFRFEEVMRTDFDRSRAGFSCNTHLNVLHELLEHIDCRPAWWLEDPQDLGETLVLPPWLEPNRAGIEAALPALTIPRA